MTANYFDNSQSLDSFPFGTVLELLLKNDGIFVNCTNTIRDILTSVKKLCSSDKKQIGQYFTSSKLVTEFYRHFFKNDYLYNKKRFFTLLDLSAGKGDFLWPILLNKKREWFHLYAVEIDKFLYYYLLFWR